MEKVKIEVAYTLEDIIEINKDIVNKMVSCCMKDELISNELEKEFVAQVCDAIDGKILQIETATNFDYDELFCFPIFIGEDKVETKKEKYIKDKEKIKITYTVVKNIEMDKKFIENYYKMQMEEIPYSDEMFSEFEELVEKSINDKRFIEIYSAYYLDEEIYAN